MKKVKKVKKILVLASLFAFVLGSVGFCANTDPKITSAAAKYKSGNYVGCLQDAQDVITKDPSNAVAHYYMAIAYVKIGMKDKAISSYNNVLGLNTTETLSEYSRKGISCLENPGSCANQTNTIDDLEAFINKKTTVGQDSEKLLKQLELEKIKNNMNNELRNLPNKSEAIDYTKISEQPSNDEIVWAIKTLQKSGINPYPATQMGLNFGTTTGNSGYYPQNSDMSQLNMLMSNSQNNNNNNFNNMLPYILSAQQNGQKINPEAVKTMMMSSMMSDFSAFDTKQQDF